MYRKERLNKASERLERGGRSSLCTVLRERGEAGKNKTKKTKPKQNKTNQKNAAEQPRGFERKYIPASKSATARAGIPFCRIAGSFERCNVSATALSLDAGLSGSIAGDQGCSDEGY